MTIYNKLRLINFIVLFIHCFTLFSAAPVNQSRALASPITSPRIETEYTEPLIVPLPQSIEFARDVDMLTRIAEKSMQKEFETGFLHEIGKIRTETLSEYERMQEKIKADNLRNFQAKTAALKKSSVAAFNAKKDQLKIKKQFIEKFKKLELERSPQKDERKLNTEAEATYQASFLHADVMIEEYLSKINITWDPEEGVAASR